MPLKRALEKLGAGPMIFPPSVDDGLHAMLFLASKPLGQRFPVKELARAVRAPFRRLSPALKKLAKAGFLSALSEARAGYALRRFPSNITLRDIVETLHGPVYLRNCQRSARLCKRSPACAFRPFWRGVQRDLTEKLAKQNLQDLVKISFWRRNFSRARF